MKLSLSIIVKNEANHLAKALDSVKGIDEIVVCDTGSEDNTIEIAKRYTDKVFTDYKWNDNFAEARNHVLSKCTGDWILIVDADEHLVNPIEDVRTVAIDADSKGFKTVQCLVKSEIGGNIHRQPRLFKRCSEVYWKGAIHNYLNTVEGYYSDLTIVYGYSDAHKKDPDRTKRILIKELEKDPSLVREKYYLAREYWYRKDYQTALDWFNKHLQTATWLPERADSYLFGARCLWNMKQGEQARQYCLNAININANFKEALVLMAEMSWPKNKEQWLKFSELADNSNVLFIRN